MKMRVSSDFYVPEKESVRDLLEACYSMLNVEAAARIGAEYPALKGLDIDYHFKKLRETIAKAETDLGHNACLAAAAPALLNACKNVIWKLSHGGDKGKGFEMNTIDLKDAVVRLCEKAIAKAEGR
jgi:hypothetical protein